MRLWRQHNETDDNEGLNLPKEHQGQDPGDQWRSTGIKKREKSSLNSLEKASQLGTGKADHSDQRQTPNQKPPLDVLLTAHADNHSRFRFFTPPKTAIRTKDQKGAQHLPQQKTPEGQRIAMQIPQTKPQTLQGQVGWFPLWKSLCTPSTLPSLNGE